MTLQKYSYTKNGIILKRVGKMMTPKEYSYTKNKIVLKHVGKPLMLPSNIIDIPLTDKMVSNMEKYIDTLDGIYDCIGVYPITVNNCPYCATYRKEEVNGTIGIVCTGCPMLIDDNFCLKKGSTFNVCDNIIKQDSFDTKNLSKDLLTLAKEFVVRNKHKGKL